VRLQFLGSDSAEGECPTLFATDRGTYNYWRDAAQHWAVRRDDFAAEYDK
jgi:hypothetical protein